MREYKRALSLKAANACENADNHRCRCRCQGAAHGRAKVEAASANDREPFEKLPVDDPHHLPTEAQRKEAARKKLPGWEQLTIAVP